MSQISQERSNGTAVERRLKAVPTLPGVTGNVGTFTQGRFNPFQQPKAAAVCFIQSFIRSVVTGVPTQVPTHY
jgi:hypothetical protein